jgi:hypothetical protein
MKALLSITFAAAWLHSAALAQNPFINLDFESASLVPVGYPNFGNPMDAAAALPGWRVSTRDSLMPWVLYNDITLTPYASVSLFSPPRSVISGQYSVQIWSGLQHQFTGSNVWTSTALSQTGLVPAGTRSIRLTVVHDAFDVSLGGSSLSLVPLSPGTNANGIPYTVWGADITGHANLTEELRITVPYDAGVPFGRYHSIWLDDISFSPNPIPEPGTWALLGLGAAAWFLTKGRRR